MTKVLHEKEIEQFHSKENEKAKVEFLASRWALKEAMVKALGERSFFFPGFYLEKQEEFQKPIPKIDFEKN